MNEHENDEHEKLCLKVAIEIVFHFVCGHMYLWKEALKRRQPKFKCKKSVELESSC